MRVKQKLLTAYHLQTDENAEVLNQYINQQLCPFVNYFQDNWLDLLLAMNFAQAILPHESTGISPYELKLSQASRLHFNWKEQTQFSSTVREQLTREEAQTFVIRTQDTVKWAKSNLERAQNRMTHQANKHWRVWNRVLSPRPCIAFHHDAMPEYAHVGHRICAYQWQLYRPASISVTEEWGKKWGEKWGENWGEKWGI